MSRLIFLSLIVSCGIFRGAFAAPAAANVDALRLSAEQANVMESRLIVQLAKEIVKEAELEEKALAYLEEIGGDKAMEVAWDRAMEWAEGKATEEDRPEEVKMEGAGENQMAGDENKQANAHKEQIGGNNNNEASSTKTTKKCESPIAPFDTIPCGRLQSSRTESEAESNRRLLKEYAALMALLDGKK